MKKRKVILIIINIKDEKNSTDRESPPLIHSNSIKNINTDRIKFVSE